GVSGGGSRHGVRRGGVAWDGAASGGRGGRRCGWVWGGGGGGVGEGVGGGWGGGGWVGGGGGRGGRGWGVGVLGRCPAVEARGGREEECEVGGEGRMAGGVG
ncbi:hypothetical protein HGQ98_34485, partial [Achromobacter ruhlandii]